MNIEAAKLENYERDEVVNYVRNTGRLHHPAKKTFATEKSFIKNPKLTLLHTHALKIYKETNTTTQILVFFAVNSSMYKKTLSILQPSEFSN